MIGLRQHFSQRCRGMSWARHPGSRRRSTILRSYNRWFPLDVRRNQYGQVAMDQLLIVQSPTRWDRHGMGKPLQPENLRSSIAAEIGRFLWAWGTMVTASSATVHNRPALTCPDRTDTDWVSVAAGTDHTVALRSNGTLWAWGRNQALRDRERNESPPALPGPDRMDTIGPPSERGRPIP